jgi:hypothetical protein
MTHNEMTRNNRKAAIRRPQRPFIVFLVSLILLPGKPILAEDGGSLLSSQPVSAGNALEVDYEIIN